MFYKVNRILRTSNIFCRVFLRHRRLSTKIGLKSAGDTNNNSSKEPFADVIKKYESSVIYSSYIEKKMKIGYVTNKIIETKRQKLENRERINKASIEPLPISLKLYAGDSADVLLNQSIDEENGQEREIVQFPFQSDKESVISNSNLDSKRPVLHSDIKHLDPAIKAKEEVESKLTTYKNVDPNWMRAYDNFEETDDTEDGIFINNINYGKPDPKSKISNTPCGGCGALLHCKDTSIPGYIPSEIFHNCNHPGGVSLKAVLCQRCYFLRNHNLALQVTVSAEDYSHVLRTIPKHENALVVLMVDLLDFPCSIWPGAADLLGKGRPIFVVGNKVDLLPQDGHNFLHRIETNLRNELKLNGFPSTNIKHVSLISATTGFGVEEFITKLQKFWEFQGDVYLVGCTNVGKSSLFNALLQSDYCKVHAVNLIQRATISQWPGTTLNLLKFPISRPSGYKLAMRFKRLMATNKILQQERELRVQQLRSTRNPKYASLIGHLTTTFSPKDVVEDNGQDFFNVSASGNVKQQIGINEKDVMYAQSKWCYDTPGVIQKEQVLHLLTAEELMLTIPKQLVQPRTFVIKPKHSIFIGGLSRLDFLDGVESTRFTIFASSSLPITICQLEDADKLYDDFLQTDFFAVPVNNAERLKFWPGLSKVKTFEVVGVDSNVSCADVLLSSSGWIAVTPREGKRVTIKAWVPPDCGIYLRDPLLPNAVGLRGRRISGSPAYRTDRFYIPNVKK